MHCPHCGGHLPLAVLEALAAHNPEIQTLIDSETFQWLRLEPRERDVVTLVAQGLSNREIAERLIFSPHTVKGYLYALYGKLGVRNRHELTIEALRRGFATLESPTA